MQAYADPLIDKIDINRVVSKRWFREVQHLILQKNQFVVVLHSTRR